MINTGNGPRGELRPRTVSAEAVTCGKTEERTDVGPQWTDTAHPGPIRASVSTTIETSTDATRQDRTEQGRRPAEPALAGASESCDLRICRTSPIPAHAAAMPDRTHTPYAPGYQQGHRPAETTLTNDQLQRGAAGSRAPAAGADGPVTCGYTAAGGRAPSPRRFPARAEPICDRCSTSTETRGNRTHARSSLAGCCRRIRTCADGR